MKWRIIVILIISFIAEALLIVLVAKATFKILLSLLKEIVVDCRVTSIVYGNSIFMNNDGNTAIRTWEYLTFYGTWLLWGSGGGGDQPHVR